MRRDAFASSPQPDCRQEPNRWSRTIAQMHDCSSSHVVFQYFWQFVLRNILCAVDQRFLAALIEMLETFHAEPCFLLTSVMICPALFRITLRLPRIVRGGPTSCGCAKVFLRSSFSVAVRLPLRIFSMSPRPRVETWPLSPSCFPCIKPITTLNAG